MKNFLTQGKMIFTGLGMMAMLLGTVGLSEAVTIQDAVNDDKTSSGHTWSATEVGWFYTPSFSYDLTRIETMFGTSVDGRTVTVEIYDEHPGAGGSLLRSAGFNPLSNAFAGGSFASLGLTAGEDYFVGFRNVGGLNVNVTNDAGAINLPGGLRFSFLNNGSYSNGPETHFTAQPILRFFGDPVAQPVPEPSTILLLGSGLVGLVAWRKKKSQM